MTGRCNRAISKFQPKSLDHSLPLDLSHILLPLQLNHITASLRGFAPAPSACTDQDENPNTSDPTRGNEKQNQAKMKLERCVIFAAQLSAKATRLEAAPGPPSPASACCQIHSH